MTIEPHRWYRLTMVIVGDEMRIGADPVIAFRAAADGEIYDMEQMTAAHSADAAGDARDLVRRGLAIAIQEEGDENRQTEL